MRTRESALCVALTAAALLGGCVGTHAATQTPVHAPVELKGTDGPIYALAWAPDGKTLASAGYRQVNLWRLGANLPPRTFTLHTDLVRGVAWSPDGSSLASVGDDGLARVWNARTLALIATLESGASRAVRWSPDGRHLAVGSGFQLQIWQVSSRVLLRIARVQTQISSVSWSPDGKTVAVGGVNGMTTLWTAHTGALATRMNTTGQGRNDVNGVAWSPSGRLLATAHGAQGQGEVRLWNPVNATLLHMLPSPAGWLRGISWSPDGQWIAAGGEDGQLRIWNVEAGELAAALSTDSKPIWSVAWSPDGRFLAVGNTGSRTTGGTVSVWPAPVVTMQGRSAGHRARAVETALLGRRPLAVLTAVERASVPTVFKDGVANGFVIGVEPPFGNLETSFIEADLRALGIAPGDRFTMRCRETTFTLVRSESVGEVAKGNWVAYLSLDGRLIVARSFASAAESSGCKVGDGVVASAG